MNEMPGCLSQAMQTHKSFFIAMHVNRESTFAPNDHFWTINPMNVLTREQFIKQVAAEESQLTHRLEYQLSRRNNKNSNYRGSDYCIVSRHIDKWRLHAFCLKVTVWDSAWLREIILNSPAETGEFLNKAMEDAIRSFTRSTGWKVYGYQFGSHANQDFVLLYASPRIPLPIDLGVSNACVGRPRIKSGICIQMPFGNVLVKISPQTLSVIRLRRANIQGGLDLELQNAGRDERLAFLAKVAKDSKRHLMLALWHWMGEHAPTTKLPIMPRSFDVPIVLTAHLQLDASFCRARAALYHPDSVSAFMAEVKTARSRLGGLLQEELYTSQSVSTVTLPISRHS
jgi:hypothetical protein